MEAFEECSGTEHLWLQFISALKTFIQHALDTQELCVADPTSGQRPARCSAQHLHAWMYTGQWQSGANVSEVGSFHAVAYTCGDIAYCVMQVAVLDSGWVPALQAVARFLEHMNRSCS